MNRMLRSLMILAAMLGVALASVARAADTPPPPFVTANAAAARGDHAAAAAAFEQSIEHDGWSVNALLGLGNAYANLGEHGRAILALERARLIAPEDEAVATNLARERERAAVTGPDVSRADAVLGRVTADTWTWLALWGAVVACAGVLAIAWSSRRRLGSGLTIAGVTVALGAGAIALRVAPAPDRAIVLVEGTARIAPFAAAEPAFPARPGEAVQIEMQRGDHVYVRAGEDRTGWLPRTALERVVPSDRRSSRS